MDYIVKIILQFISLCQEMSTNSAKTKDGYTLAHHMYFKCSLDIPTPKCYHIFSKQWIKRGNKMFEDFFVYYRSAMLSDLARLIAIPSVKSEPEQNAPFGRACVRALEEAEAICVEST